jgi:hypothetical protein
MSGNGLFDSDDEDDVQYNPDEGNDEEPLDNTPAYPAMAPTPIPVPAPAPVYAQPSNYEEEEEKYPSQVPVPMPVQPSGTKSIPVPQPVPVIPYSSADTEDEAFFTVSEPVNTGHINYTVRGRDEDGEFEGQRRYNDFHNLRNSLINRWPGTYVPAIPSKKAVGNKDDKYIEHRRHFLQRFLRKISQLPYLLNSDEFKLFARPSGDIEKMLNMLPRMTPSALVERYKTTLHIDEYPDDFLNKQCREIIGEFYSFCKKVLPTLKSLREQTAKMVPVRAQQNANYKLLVNTM